MEACPSCKAAYRGGITCHRCGAELAAVLAIERAAAEHRAQSSQALSDRLPHTAWLHASRACELHRCPESLKCLALANLACGRFEAAVRVAQELPESGG